MVHLSNYLNLSETSVHSDLQKSISMCSVLSWITILNEVISEQQSLYSPSLILPDI